MQSVNSGGTGVQRRCENEYYQPASCNGHISLPSHLSISSQFLCDAAGPKDPLWELLFQMILITVC